MNNTYKLINSDNSIKVDLNKNQILLCETNTYSRIIKRENNVLYISDKSSDFLASILIFNQSALLWEQDKPILAHQFDFSGSAIYKIPQHKTLFFKIPKNACSTIVSECYNRFYKKWYEPKCTTEQWIFRDILPKINYRNNFEIIKQEYEFIKDEYKDWKKFLVFDDPLKRFLRLLNHKYMQPDVNIASIIKPQHNIERYIDEMILIAQADNLNTRYHDTHLTSIVNIWEEFLDEIDAFVNLQDLDNFIKDQFNFYPKRFLETKNKKPISQADLTEKQLEQVKIIFEKDYEIPKIYKEKFYIK